MPEDANLRAKRRLAGLPPLRSKRWLGVVAVAAGLAGACKISGATQPPVADAPVSADDPQAVASEGGTPTDDGLETEAAKPDSQSDPTSASEPMADASTPHAEDDVDTQTAALEAEVEIPRMGDEMQARMIRLQPLIRAAAEKHEIDADLFNAVVWVESKFDPRARGPAGAQGLMQLMPRTAKGLAKRLERKARPYDPEFNLDAGGLYLHRLLARFDGDERLALTAYNRGVGRVLGWVENGEPFPEGVVKYVDRVMEARAWIPVFLARHESADPASRAASAPEGEDEGDQGAVSRPVAWDGFAALRNRLSF